MISFGLLSFVFLAIVNLTFAADCYGGEGIDPNVGSAWQLRDQVCGHNACGNQDTANGNNHFCSIFLPFGNGQAVQMQRSDSSGQFKNCYDATENILTQCLDNSAGSGLTGDPNGSWKLGDEWYWITMNRSIGALPNEEFADMQNGVPIEGYMFGPDQFCQGLSPGGGDSCIDIPDGCFIAVPLDNTVPQINCTLPYDIDSDA